MPLVEHELLTHPGYPSSPPLICGVRATRSLALGMFFLFPLAIVLSALYLRILTTPFGIDLQTLLPVKKGKVDLFLR